MVLSNKKLKQKLREAKAQVLAASGTAASSAGTPNSEAQETVKSILAAVSQKSKLFRKKKRKEKAIPLQQNGENMDASDEDEDVVVENEEEVKKKKKKRKRDEEGKEVERREVKEKKLKTKKKKKKKKKKVKKEKVEKGVAEESIAYENEASGNHHLGEKNDTTINEASSNDGSMKVYVGGIPYYSTEDDIRSFFEGCGTITGIDCMHFPESGKFRGIAIISFMTEAAAKRALALDGSDMGGLFLKIQPYKSERSSKTSGFSPALVEGYNRIYAGNLSYDITENDLKKLFSICKIKSIRFGEDKETGQFRGYAHVDFSDSVSLSMALKLDQTVVHGRPIRISCAVPRKESVKKSQPMQEELVKESQPIQESVRPARTEEYVVNLHPTPNAATPVDDAGMANVSGKIRRRTCYECGERGHLFSACPKRQASAQPIQEESINKSQPIKEEPFKKSQPIEESVPRAGTEEYVVNLHPTPNAATPADDAGMASVSGKIRRRTCYECGERGHLSSACPNKQASAEPIQEESINKSQPIEEEPFKKPQPIEESVPRARTEECVVNLQPTLNATSPADGAGVANVSEKIRRRTCYECGERGHLSSACPKKQASAQTNPVST